MSWPLVERAFFPPAQCIVTGGADGPFFDFGDRDPAGSRVYVAADVVMACARELGMVPREDFIALERKVHELSEKYANLDRYREAVEALETAEKQVAA